MSPLPKRNNIFAFKAPLSIDVLIELYGTIILCHSLLHLILSNVETLLDILMVQIAKYKPTFITLFYTLRKSLLRRKIRTPFTVHQLNKMYAGTFNFMPTDKDWIYDPSRNPYHNCPAHHHLKPTLLVGV